MATNTITAHWAQTMKDIWLLANQRNCIQVIFSIQGNLPPENIIAQFFLNVWNTNQNFEISFSREATPPYGENATPIEEVTHLRRQVARLNRRVLSIEIENLQRQQREKVVYLLGLAYFCFKAIMWLNRN